MRVEGGEVTGALAGSGGDQMAEIVYHAAILNLLCKTQPSNRTKQAYDSTELPLPESANNVEPIYLSNYTKRDVVTARMENRQDLRIHIDKAKTGALLNQILLHGSVQRLRFIGLFSLKSNGC